LSLSRAALALPSLWSKAKAVYDVGFCKGWPIAGAQGENDCPARGIGALRDGDKQARLIAVTNVRAHRTQIIFATQPNIFRCSGAARLLGCFVTDCSPLCIAFNY